MSNSDISMSISTSSSDEDERRRTFKPRMNPFEFYNDEEFKNRYRLTKAVVTLLVNLIEPKIKPFTLRNRSICALEQVLLTISYFASGAFQITVADHIRIHKSTACRIIKKVSAAIAELRPHFISMPNTHQDRNRIKSEFFNISSFPNVIGCIDCTHIKIQSPGGSRAELYRNRKGYFSLNVQVICDANLKIMDVICRWPGSVHDTTIINDSHIRADFESGVYGSDYLLGDSGYPCRAYLLTPFLRPSTPSEEAYNQAHIKTRNTVERCFGVLKRRFPCLSMGLRVKLPTSMNIIVACCVLHNLALNHNDHIEDATNSSLELDEQEDTGPNSVINENTSVRSSILLTYFNC